MFPLQVNIPLKIFSKFVLYQSVETLLFHKWGHHIEFILAEFAISKCYIKGAQSKFLWRFSISCELWNSSLKEQLTFFTAINNLSGPLRKQKLTSAGSKGCICQSWLVVFNPFFSVFQGSLAVTIILIDGREKPNRQLGFELQSWHVIENRNKVILAT